MEDDGSKFKDEEEAFKAINDYFKTLGFIKAEIIHNPEKGYDELIVTK